MTKKLYKFLAIFLMIQILLSAFAPVVVYANDAVMLEALIEPQTKTYKVDMVEDKPTWFANHYEQKYINFNSYYTKICSEALDASNEYDSGKLAKDPTLCTSLDSDVVLDSDAGEFKDAYSMFMFTEGYRKGSNLINDDSKKAESDDNALAKKTIFIKDVDKNKGMKPLTFPSSHGEGKNVTEGETEHAIKVGNTLSSNLNSMLAFINNGKKFQSVTELVNKSILIRPTDNGFTIIEGTKNTKNFIILYGTLDVYGSSTDKVRKSGAADLSKLGASFTASDFWQKGDFPNVDADGNLLAYVIPTSQTNLSYNAGGVTLSSMDGNGIASFVWAMPKGYINIPDVDNSLRFTNDSHEPYKFADVPWVTIHQLTMYANNAYKNFNISMSSKLTGEGNGNMIMEIIVGIVKMLINGLRSILGLSDTYSLVFNKGARGSSSYNYGAMADSWWTVVLRYHIIFQSLAWFLIITGLIKTLIDLNLSTINPGKRMHVYKTIERFIVVGFGLVLIIPIVQFMLNMNDSIVKIFASQADPNASSPPVIGTLAGLVLQVAYFGIVVYINFTYIMRSIIIGILIVTAPFFIASMAFSDNNRQLFSSWARELIANIFMQSIHAFTLAFLTNLISTGGGLESLVVSYSIIPITELVRTLVFQGAGGHASQLGKAAGAKFMNMAQGAASVGAGMATGLIGKGLDKGNESGDTSLSEGAKGGKGAKGGDSTGLQGLSTAIDSRMTGIKNGANAKMSNDHAGRGAKAVQHTKKAFANAMQTGLAGANAVGALGSAAWDMAMGEMTNDVSAYKSAGSNLATAGAKGAQAIGRGAQTAGEVGLATAGQGVGKLADVTGATAKASQIKQAGQQWASDKINEMKNNRSSDSQNLALTASSINHDSRTGLTMSKFTNSSRGGAIYANEGKNLTETISGGGIAHMAKGNHELAGFYQDVQKIQGGDTELQQKYANDGVMIQTGDGGGAKITYTEPFLHRNNIISATANKGGKSFVTRSHTDVGAFGHKESSMYSKALNPNDNNNGNNPSNGNNPPNGNNNSATN